MKPNEIMKKLHIESTGDFSEEIVKDLVKKGLSGQELIDEFQRIKPQVRPTVERLISEPILESESLNENEEQQIEGLFKNSKE